MTLVYPPPLLEHVLSLLGARVRGSVCIDIRADIGEEVSAVARFGNSGGQTLEFAAVVLEDFTVAGEVVLFQGGGGESSFGVEEAGQLGD